MLSKVIPYLPVESRIFTAIYKRFCDDEQTLRKTIENFQKHKTGVILDYAVEGSKADSSKTSAIILSTARSYNPSFVAIKPSSLTIADMRHIMKHSPVPVMVDAEQYDVQKEMHPIVRELQLEFNTPFKCQVYNTYQCYLRHSFQLLQDDMQLFRQKQRALGIKLVRGAYLDHELRRNPNILCANQLQTDANYNRALLMILKHLNTAHDHFPRISVVVATHNRRSIELAMRTSHASTSQLSFAQLKGMRDDLTNMVISHGFQGLKYVPYGPKKEVISYLVRRAQENPFILRSLFS